MDALDFINILAPEHSRTSCSDDNVSNGFCFEYDDHFLETGKTINKKYLPRCKRCAYLDILNDKVLLTEENLKLINEQLW